MFPVLGACLVWYFAYVLLAELRARLHVDARVRQRQRGDAARPRAGRHDVRGDHLVRAASRTARSTRSPTEIREEQIEADAAAASAPRGRTADAIRSKPPAVTLARRALAQHRHLRRVRRDHADHRVPREPQQQDRRRLLRRRPLVHRRPERLRHRRRLPVGGILPRHRRRDRGHGLRRVPLLDRIPRGVARRAAARRGAAAQHGPVHDGRRAVVPAQAAPGAHRRGDDDARRVLLLPARADGRSRRPRVAAARHRRPGRPGAS